MKKNYCKHCQKEVNEDIKKCECGNSSFVFGEVTLTDKGFACKCGNNTFNKTLHMDFKDKYVDNFKCTKCGNVIGTESYRDESSIMYWD